MYVCVFRYLHICVICINMLILYINRHDYLDDSVTSKNFLYFVICQ